MASEREEVADAGSHGSSKQMPNRMLGPVSNPPAALPSHVAVFFHATKQDGTALEHRFQTRGWQVVPIFIDAQLGVAVWSKVHRMQCTHATGTSAMPCQCIYTLPTGRSSYRICGCTVVGAPPMPALISCHVMLWAR